jgi:hypothetical protein
MLGRPAHTVGLATHVWAHGCGENGIVLERADEAQRVGRLLNPVAAAVVGEDQLGVGETVRKADRERAARLRGIGGTPGRTDRRSDASGSREPGSAEGCERKDQPVDREASHGPEVKPGRE